MNTAYPSWGNLKKRKQRKENTSHRKESSRNAEEKWSFWVDSKQGKTGPLYGVVDSNVDVIMGTEIGNQTKPT